MQSIPYITYRALRAGVIGSEKARRALLSMRPIYYNLIDHASSPADSSSWSDSFTTDNLASTYSPFAGSQDIEGTDYTISDGKLTVINQITWLDLRATGLTIDTSLTIQAIENLFLVIIGLHDIPSDTVDNIAAYGSCIGPTQGNFCLLVVGDSDQPDQVQNLTQDALPDTGEATLRFVCSATEMTLFVNGTEVLALAIPDQQQADLASQPLYPIVELTPVADEDLVVTHWSYEVR